MQVNRTIDDEYGDSVTGAKPVYAPSGSDFYADWKQGLDCVTPCVFLPNAVVDPSQAVNGTWHDSTYRATGNTPHTITAPFTGTAVYVYFIVPNFNPVATTLVNVSFTIDGTYRGEYLHMPDITTTILYQTLVFHTTDLANAGHTIEVRADGPNDSLLLFDNMVYTAEETDPPSTPTASVATPAPTSSTMTPSNSSGAKTTIDAIACGVAGGVTVLALLLLFLHLRRRRHGPSRATLSYPHPSLAEHAQPEAAFRDTSSGAPDASQSSLVVKFTPASSRAYLDSLTQLEDGSSGHTKSFISSAMTTSRRASTAVGAGDDGFPSHRNAAIPSTGQPALHAQVAVLQEEVARLRHVEAEMHQLYLPSPPRYDRSEERHSLGSSFGAVG